MNIDDLLVLHQQIQTKQQDLIAALSNEDPDMEFCLELATHISDALTHLPSVSQLTDLTDQTRENLLKSVRITASLLQRYQSTVLQMRQQFTDTQVRAERGGAAIRQYQAASPVVTLGSNAAESPQFLDEKR
jgi:hypothetical protein